MDELVLAVKCHVSRREVQAVIECVPDGEVVQANRLLNEAATVSCLCKARLLDEVFIVEVADDRVLRFLVDRTLQCQSEIFETQAVEVNLQITPMVQLLHVAFEATELVEELKQSHLDNERL